MGDRSLAVLVFPPARARAFQRARRWTKLISSAGSWTLNAACFEESRRAEVTSHRAGQNLLSISQLDVEMI